MVNKERKELIENCFALRITDLDSRLFSGSNNVVNGSLLLSVGKEELSVDYEVCDDTLYIKYGDSEQGIEIQRIVAFRGYKRYFKCECGRRCKSLYLKPDGGERFACRAACNNLTYLSNRVTRDTVNGAVFSDFNRLTRLIERREKMSPWYRGEPTKKFQKLLSDAERYGFHSFADWQRSGIKDIQDMKRAVEIARNG